MLAGLAALPDLDLVYPPIHRAFTHSVGSVILVTIIGAVVTGWVTGRRSIGFGALCGVAWASHLLLDWLGVDPNPPSGIKALWPFSDGWFISSLQIFPGTERRQVFTAAAFATNFYAVAIEIAILAPVVVALWAGAASRRRARRAPPRAATGRSCRLAAITRRCKSPGRTFCQDVRQRPSGAAADTVDTWDRRSPRAAR